MPIGFVLDENCRGPLWSAIRSHNLRGIDKLDVVRVGGNWIAHLQAGLHSPGIFIPRSNATLPEIVEVLVIVAHSSDLVEWLDRLEYIPFSV